MKSAYQPGRSTTEQVFAVKILAEKAILGSDYKLHLLPLDMSKAFNTVDRKMLFEELEEILVDDEIHLLSMITNLPEIKVKIRVIVGESFLTNTGNSLHIVLCMMSTKTNKNQNERFFHQTEIRRRSYILRQIKD